VPVASWFFCHLLFVLASSFCEFGYSVDAVFERISNVP
jgi:hypothetical protein